MQKLVFDYIKHEKKEFIIYLLIVVCLYPIETILISYLNGILFSLVSDKKLDIKYIYRLIYCIIGVYLGATIIDYYKRNMENNILPQYLSYMRQKIFENTIYLHENETTDLKMGKFITRVMDITREMKNLMIINFNQIIPNVVVLICVIFAFTIIDSVLGLISIFFTALIIGVLYLMGHKCLQLATDKEEVYLEMTDKIDNSLSNLTNIYLNGESNNEIQKNKQIDEKYTDVAVNAVSYTNVLNKIISLLIIAMFAALMFYAFRLFLNKQINIPTLFTVLMILEYMVFSLQTLCDIIPEYINRLGIINNSSGFLTDIFMMGERHKENNKQMILKGDIKYENVSFSYITDKGQKLLLFDNINLTIKDKEIIGLMGPSGSGKSSLMKLLLKLHKIDSGTIYVDGKDINNYSNEYLRSKIIYVNQKTNLFDDTIINNIKYGNEPLSDKEIISVMQKYDLLTNFSSIKGGLYSMCGQNGGNLSGGMQKIVIILRGIFKKNAKIIIFDEPLTGLDPKTRVKVMKLIKDTSKICNDLGDCTTKTVIVITHDKEVIQYVDRVINIEDIKNKK